MGTFDYRYTTGSGKNSHTYRQTVVFFRSPEVDLPQFELKPQSFLHGIGKLFGYQDIDFAFPSEVLKKRSSCAGARKGGATSVHSRTAVVLRNQAPGQHRRPGTRSDFLPVLPDA